MGLLGHDLKNKWVSPGAGAGQGGEASHGSRLSLGGSHQREGAMDCVGVGVQCREKRC